MLLIMANSTRMIMSPPIRGRGLKFTDTMPTMPEVLVAPYTGAWIEINIIGEEFRVVYGRPLYGGVD